MVLRDPEEICAKLFKLGDSTSFRASDIIDGITYLLNQKYIDWIEYDTDKPRVIHINPKKRSSVQVLAEAMCWSPKEVTWECQTENGDFTTSTRIRSLRDMKRPADNSKKIERMIKKLEEAESSDYSELDDMKKDGLFVRIAW